MEAGHPRPACAARARRLQKRIITVRGQKVILDADLAQVYGVSTKALNQAIKRNRDKFPSDFMFQFTNQEVKEMRSQIVTASEKRNIRFRPYAFTEHGAVMVATVLNRRGNRSGSALVCVEAVMP